MPLNNFSLLGYKSFLLCFACDTEYESCKHFYLPADTVLNFVNKECKNSRRGMALTLVCFCSCSHSTQPPPMCRTSTGIYPPESFTDRERGPPSELQQHTSRWLANKIYRIPSDRLLIKSWWHTSGKHPGCLASAPNSGLYTHHFAVGSFLLASPHQRHLCQILYYPTGLRPHPFHESVF